MRGTPKSFAHAARGGAAAGCLREVGAPRGDAGEVGRPHPPASAGDQDLAAGTWREFPLRGKAGRRLSGLWAQVWVTLSLSCDQEPQGVIVTSV